MSFWKGKSKVRMEIMRLEHSRNFLDTHRTLNEICGVDIEAEKARLDAAIADARDRLSKMPAEWEYM